MSIRLYVQEEDGELRELEFDEPTVLIGRGPENHVVITDARSSRKHCSVSETPHGAVLEDLGSSNGTVKDGETVQRALLEPGSVFRIGKTQFHFQTRGVSATGTPEAGRSTVPTGESDREVAVDGEAAAGAGLLEDDGVLEFDIAGSETSSSESPLLEEDGSGVGGTDVVPVEPARAGHRAPLRSRSRRPASSRGWSLSRDDSTAPSSRSPGCLFPSVGHRSVT